MTAVSTSPAPGPTPLLHVMLLDRAVSALLAEALRDAPLRAHDYGIVSAIQEQPGVSASALAEQFSVPLTTVAEWLSRLTELGILRRERDPADRRRQQLWLTEAGHATMAQTREAFGRGYLSFVDHLPVPPEEASAQLEAMTQACRAALDSMLSARETQG